MQKRLLIALFVMFALDITCTDSGKLRKRRETLESTVAGHKTAAKEICQPGSEDCEETYRSTRASNRAPAKKTTTKPYAKTSMKYKATTASKATTTSAKHTTRSAKPTTRYAKPTTRSVKHTTRSAKPAPTVKPTATKHQQVAKAKKINNNGRKHVAENYISRLFIVEEPSSVDNSYRRPLRTSDREDDKLPAGERELGVKDLEDHVARSEFARSKHFIQMDQAIGLRRAVMGLLFVVVAMPACMLMLINCCGRRGSPKKQTDEEKYMESLLSTPLLTSNSPGVNSNNQCNYQGESNHNYQSSYPRLSSPSVTVFVPPV